MESELFNNNWVQLATIGIDQKPRVRTVVFRGWTESYKMQIYTDKRSQKYHELSLNNNVEICWLFLRSKCQFRFRGTTTLTIGKDNQSHWTELSQKSKDMWSWASPGELYEDEKNKKISNNTNENLSENFSLLVVNITHVDQLLLHKPIHMRRRWLRSNEWREERINP
tara:strand:- start:759 stop:1262 length:504 start_codon:yes stop_codon:yes gene_type:complete